MDTRTPTCASLLARGCRERAEPLREAWAAFLEKPCVVEISDPQPIDTDTLFDSSPGLIFEFECQQVTLLAVMSGGGGLLPDWCQEGNELSQDRLNQFAEQLGTQLVPVELALQASRASLVSDLNDEVGKRLPHPVSYGVALLLSGGDAKETLRLLCPEFESEAAADTTDATASRPQAPGLSGEMKGQPAPSYANLDDGIRQLPPYARSLLKIMVPVKVTLAETRLPLKRVFELGPGSIIQFKKSCEDTLTLEAGEQPIAEGEAVKVGDKFGLWITSIALPAERFFVMRGKGNWKRVQ